MRVFDLCKQCHSAASWALPAPDCPILLKKHTGVLLAQEGENVVLIADIGGTNCRFELWDIDLQDRTRHRELFHIVRRPCFLRAAWQQRISHHKALSRALVRCKLAQQFR